MIHNLVISGGSTKTVAAVGCLKFLEENAMLKGIINYIGTSAGSILCLFLILEYTTSEILEFFKREMLANGRFNLDFDELLSLNFLDSYGIDSGANIEAFVRDVIAHKLGQKDVTFMDLAKSTGKNLVVCVSNITKQCQEYLNVDSAPTLSVVTAIRMSVSLPFLFTPVSHNGCLYVDGALYESLPIGYIQRCFHDPLKDTVAISTRTVIDTTVKSFADYLKVLVSSILDKANCQAECEKVKILEVTFEDGDAMPINVETMSFDMDEEKIEANVQKGYAAIERCFADAQSP